MRSDFAKRKKKGGKKEKISEIDSLSTTSKNVDLTEKMWKSNFAQNKRKEKIREIDSLLTITTSKNVDFTGKMLIFP